MGLISAVLGWVLRKAGVFLALVLTLFFGLLVIRTLVPSLQEAVADRDRLEEVAEDRVGLEKDVELLRKAADEGRSEAVVALATRAAAEVEERRRDVESARSDVERLRDDEFDACGVLGDLVALAPGSSPCEAAESAARRADETLDTLEGSFELASREYSILTDRSQTDQEKLDELDEDGQASAVERELDATEAELRSTRAEETSLRQTQNTVPGVVVGLWERTWRWLLGVALLVLLLPVLARVLSYFVLMPIVSRIGAPVRLAAGADVDVNAAASASEAQRSMKVPLEHGEVLSARSEHLRLVQVKVKTALFYDWRAPFVSFAAGLVEVSRVTGDEHVTSATLSTPNDPDSYLMRIDFSNHPGLMMRPKHVVGVIGRPRLQTRWRWGVQSLARWQVRYILFAGSGSVIVQGGGDVVAETPGDRPAKMDQHLVMGFDSRLSVGVRRTETFRSYLRGKKPLIDDEFIGPSGAFFWQKSNAEGPSNPVARVFGAFFSALGKLLGF